MVISGESEMVLKLSEDTTRAYSCNHNKAMYEYFLFVCAPSVPLSKSLEGQRIEGTVLAATRACCQTWQGYLYENCKHHEGESASSSPTSVDLAGYALQPDLKLPKRL
jgi:hypothetical protein